VATYKEEAIVIRAYDLGEADRIVSLITAGRGMRRAVAKGIKRTGSKFGARLEPFTRLAAVMHEGRNLDTITQAEIIRSHAPIRDDFRKFVFGEAILEMIEKSLHENQFIPRLYDALSVTLDVLEGEVHDLALLLAAFELKVCALIGYHPQLDLCIHCGGPAHGEKIRLDLTGGGITCADCCRMPEDILLLSPGALDLMRNLMSKEMAAISVLDCAPHLSREILTASFRYSESFLERPLKCRRVVIEQLEKGIRG
jgi:DNA repair protein RecO (recombination protein O)